MSIRCRAIRLLTMVVTMLVALGLAATFAALAPSAACAAGTWTARSLGTSRYLAGVAFGDVNHGWAVGDGGTILATSDGGVTWSAQSSGTTKDLTAVTFIDARRGWAVGGHSKYGVVSGPAVILVTSDGGVTWRAQNAGSDDNPLLAVTFIDANRGWAVGTSAILATTDGGATWNVQSRRVDGWAVTGWGIAFTDANHGWVVGGPFFATSDGGATWGIQLPWPYPDRGAGYGIAFTDANHGWVACSDGSILATSDGGATWNVQYSGNIGGLNAVAFVDDKRGWAVGPNTILSTTDGGASWSAQSTNGLSCNAVTFVDANHGWAVGWGDKILSYSDNVPAPDPGELNPALGKPAVVLVNGWLSKSPGEMDALKRFLEKTNSSGKRIYGDYDVMIAPSAQDATESDVIDSEGNLDVQVKRLATWIGEQDGSPGKHDLRLRPIMIIGHSYGGVIARGLVSTAAQGALQGAEYAGFRNMQHWIQGVIQLGSPNEGSPLAKALNDPGFDGQVWAARIKMPKSDATFCMAPNWMSDWNSRNSVSTVPIQRAAGLYLPTALDETGHVSWQGAIRYEYHLSPDLGPTGLLSADGVLGHMNDLLGGQPSDGVVPRTSAVSKDTYFDGGGWLTFPHLSHANGIPGDYLVQAAYSPWGPAGLFVQHAHQHLIPNPDPSYGCSVNPVFDHILWALQNPGERWGNGSGTQRASSKASLSSEADGDPGSRDLPPEKLDVSAGGSATLSLLMDGSATSLTLASKEATPVVASVAPIGSVESTVSSVQGEDGTYYTVVDLVPHLAGARSMTITLGGASGTVAVTGQASGGPSLFLDVTSDSPAVGRSVRLEARVESAGVALTGESIEATVSDGDGETAVSMKDDGEFPDAIAGDGVFSGETFLSGSPGEWSARAEAIGSSYQRAAYEGFTVGSANWARFIGTVNEVTETAGNTIARWGIVSPVDISDPGTYTVSCDVVDSSGQLVAQPSSSAALPSGTATMTTWVDGADLAVIAPGSLRVTSVRLSREVDGQTLVADTTVGPTTADYSPNDFEDFSLSLTPDFSSPTSSLTPAFHGVARYTPGYVSAVEYSLDGGSTWSAATASDGTYDEASEGFDITLAPSEGLFGLLVRSRTGDGQVLPTESWGASRFIVDATAPTALTDVSATPDLLDASVVNLAWAAPESPSATTAIVGYQVSLDMAPVTKTYDTSCPVQLPDLAGHTIRVRAVDEAGNTGPYAVLVIGDSTPPTTVATGADTGWHNAPVTVTLTPTDDAGGSGMTGGKAETEYKLDSADWTTGTEVVIPAPAEHSGDGEHHLLYRSTDAAGNTGTSENVTVRIDTKVPSTSVSGIGDGAWLKGTAKVILTAADGGSGVASITYVLDGIATSVPGSRVVVSVPVSPNSRHTLTYHATDAATNSCADQTLRFTIDTICPTTAGKAVSGRKGRKITLRYRISDNLSPQATTVKVIVKNRRGKRVKSFSLGTKTTAKWYSVKWKPKAKGTYRYYVYGKDLAGNAQRKVGSARVRVR